MELTRGAREWQSKGEVDHYRGHRIHVFERPGTDPLLLLLHGFPSSSYDWRALLEHEPDRPSSPSTSSASGSRRSHAITSTAFSGKPTWSRISLRRRPSARSVFIVAHDMGTSVATELMARDLEGRLDIELAGALLFNGSIVLERASLTPAQRLLRSRHGHVFARLTNERVFRQQFGALFSAQHPLDAQEAADQWSLICHNGGRTLGHRLIHYLDERQRYAERWHGAVRDWEGPLSFAWGLRDPVATTAVLDALIELRPGAPVDRLPELGHYPQLEDPAAIVAALHGALERATV